MDLQFNFVHNYFADVHSAKRTKILILISSCIWQLQFLVGYQYSMCNVSSGLQRDVVYLGWPIAPSYMSPNAGGGELQGLSQWEQLYTGALINFWRSNSIFHLWMYRSASLLDRPDIPAVLRGRLLLVWRDQFRLQLLGQRRAKLFGEDIGNSDLQGLSHEIDFKNLPERNIFNSITNQRSPQKILKPPATLI
jgi:hypothetical protein